MVMFFVPLGHEFPVTSEIIHIFNFHGIFMVHNEWVMKIIRVN